MATDKTVDVDRVGDSATIRIANGMTAYVWWKGQDTVRLTTIPEDLMVDITPGTITPC